MFRINDIMKHAPRQRTITVPVIYEVSCPEHRQTTNVLNNLPATVNKYEN